MSGHAAHPVFALRDGSLHCESVALEEIARRFGTPVYVYSRRAIVAAYRSFADALAGRSVARVLRGEGELEPRDPRRARAQPARRRHRVGRRARARAGRRRRSATDRVLRRRQDRGSEMRRRAGGGHRLLQRRVRRGARRARPGRAARGHARADRRCASTPTSIARPTRTSRPASRRTSSASPMAEARELYRRAPRHAQPRRCVGVDCHIGSQLTKTAPFTDAIARLVELVAAAAQPTASSSSTSTSAAASASTTATRRRRQPAEYGARGRASARCARPRRQALMLEPGRVIVGDAGALLTRVALPQAQRGEALHDRRRGDERPDASGALRLVPPDRAGARRTTRRPRVTDVVGPICETGDFFARDRELRAGAGRAAVRSAPPARTAARWRRTTTRGRAPPRCWSTAIASTRCDAARRSPS